MTTNSCSSLSHLFEHKNTVSRTDELRQLGNASLVKVRPGEATMVEVDLGAAVFPIPLDYTWTHKKKPNDGTNTEYTIGYSVSRSLGSFNETWDITPTCLWLVWHLLLDAVRRRWLWWSSAVKAMKKIRVRYWKAAEPDPFKPTKLSTPHLILTVSQAEQQQSSSLSQLKNKERLMCAQSHNYNVSLIWRPGWKKIVLCLSDH